MLTAIYPHAERFEWAPEEPTFADVLRNELKELRPSRVGRRREKLGGLPPVEKNRPDRRLGDEPEKCEESSDCGDNEYCMSCTKCEDIKNSLSTPEERQSWSCAPCSPGEKIGYCENGKYCRRSKDSIEEECPEFEGCDDHDDCGKDEYCFDCDRCRTYQQTHPYWDCDPCPTEDKGFCGMLSRCSEGTDSIDGVCPQFVGCDEHSDCGEKKYCEDCEKCNEYKLSLSEEKASAWDCPTCPTEKGGICASEKLCAIADDSIDNTCPVSGACSAHSDCSNSEYCMDCDKCEEFHDSLDANSKWSCKPCPTDTGGLCQIRQFCAVANDAIDGTCPEFIGCSRHTDCLDSPNSFCMSYEACVAEMSVTECGTKPTLGGYCVSNSYCTPERSITKKCNEIISGCSHHRECSKGQFCTRWDDCKKRRGVDVCGDEPMTEGICIDNSHCVMGLHAPIDGKCPLAGSLAHPRLSAKKAFELQGVELATFHQAMNVWYDEGSQEERVVLQMHDYFGPDTNFDDREYFASYIMQDDGTMKAEWKTVTSCPFVEIIMPHRGPYIYETRIATPLEHHDELIAYCSCLKGDFPWVTQGACPRGVALSKNAPQRVLNAFFVDTTLLSMKTKSTLYTIERRVSGLAHFIEDEDESCPKNNAGKQYDTTIGCKMLLEKGVIVPEVKGKWCVVDTKGCPVTMKYRLCRASGAIGVAVLADDSNTRDLALTIILRDAAEECEGEPIPAVFIQGLDAMTMGELNAGTLEITIGPDVPLEKPREGHTINSGGIRVFDTRTQTWVNHFEVFGAVKYVETSLLRDILFACVGEPSKIRVFDISPYVMDPTVQSHACKFVNSNEAIMGGTMTLDRCKHICANDRTCMAVNLQVTDIKPEDGTEMFRCILVRSKTPMNPTSIQWEEKELDLFLPSEYCVLKIEGPSGPAMREIVGNAPACDRGRTRDYHLVDFGRDTEFHTTLINPEDNNNHLFIYDTTDLHEWVLVETVHANWEDADSGLGQVVGNPEGDHHVVTWHCSNRFCDGSFGHNAYVLDTTSPSDGVAISAKLQLPMREGTIAKDVSCNANNLCLIGMNHDGLTLVDLSAHNGPQIIASHLETFNNETIPIPIYRMFSGAQKVYSSKQNLNRWYVERAVLDWEKVTQGVPLPMAIASDTVYTIDLEPKYDRNQVNFNAIDPVVVGAWDIALSWEDIQRIASAMFEEGVDEEVSFENHLVMATSTALKVPADRFKVLTIKTDQNKRTTVLWEIIPGAGPSPDTLFRMLQIQLKSEHSAIHSTKLQPLIEFISLSRENSPADKMENGPHSYPAPPTATSTPTPIMQREGGDWVQRKEEDSYDQVLGLAIAIGLIFVCLVTSIAFIVIKMRRARELRAEIDKKTRSTVGTSGLLSDHSAILGAQLSDGYVIGRPATGITSGSGGGDPKKGGDLDDNDNEGKGKEPPEPDNVNVVGEPVRSTLPSTRTTTRNSRNTPSSDDTSRDIELVEMDNR